MKNLSLISILCIFALQSVFAQKQEKYDNKMEVNFDKPLVATLDTIYEEDQKPRREIEEVLEKYGQNSEEITALMDIIAEKDSINLIKVKKILDERGWLGSDVIGDRGNSTLFLVIQHADIETQKKYLPKLREAVSKGNARPSQLAMLEDRIALRSGEKQIYGSQIGYDDKNGYHVSPLLDPDNVDKRRAEVGLVPIQEYLSNWGIVWDPEEHKKKLPEYELIKY